MKRIYMAVFTMFILGFLGCAVKPAVSINDENNGGSVTIKKGKIIEVKLIGQMGTGYSWELTPNDEFFILNKAPETVPAAADKDLVGGKEYTIFHLKAQKPGETELHFTYAKHWDAKDMQDTKEYLIRVLITE